MSTLLYLKESIANYADENKLGQRIYNKLKEKAYHNEEEFLENLSEKEMDYLDDVLRMEMRYARSAQDSIREKQLNEIYQLI